MPLAPWALLLCSWSPELETHSERDLIRGEAGVGRKMPSGRRPQQSPRSQLESSATRPYLTLRSKLHAGSCIRESSTLLGEQTTAPMRLCIAKQRFPFSPLDLWTPYAKESLGCLWLPGPCCFAGGLLSWKPTPKVFSFVDKQEMGGKCLLGAEPSNPPGASLGALHRDHISCSAPNSIQGAAFRKGRLSSGNKPQPQSAFAQQSTDSLFPT